MNKFVYCSHCGMKIQVFKKAIRHYGRIINLIEPHECTAESVEFDLEPTEIPVKEPDGKFVQKLNNLRPSQVNQSDLRDRRAEPEVKSSAPTSVIQRMKDQTLCTNSIGKDVNFEGSDE